MKISLKPSRGAAAERPRSGRSGNDCFMILCEMVTKPFKIGPFGMPLRRFFFLVFVLKEVVPGAGDQDSIVFLMFLIFFFMFFYVFIKNQLGEHPHRTKMTA